MTWKLFLIQFYFITCIRIQRTCTETKQKQDADGQLEA